MSALKLKFEVNERVKQGLTWQSLGYFTSGESLGFFSPPHSYLRPVAASELIQTAVYSLETPKAYKLTLVHICVNHLFLISDLTGSLPSGIRQASSLCSPRR